MPTLRGSLGFVTDTTCVADDVAPPRGHAMTVLGVAPSERVAYVVEDLGDADEAPIVYRLWLERTARRPPRADPCLVRAVRRPARDPRADRGDRADARAGDAGDDRGVDAVDAGRAAAARCAWRRPSRDSIRKFALQLKVEPVGGRGPSGHATVTAFLRPNATLAEVWMLASGDAIARVTYTGIPSGVGLTKDTVVLLT